MVGQRLSFMANRLELNAKQVFRCWGWKDVIKKDLRKMGTSWDGVKREALNRLGWRGRA